MSRYLIKNGMRIACIVPTFNGKSDLARLLDSLSKQSVAYDLFIVDSSSSDGTWELATARVERVLKIRSDEFNHGGTRSMMVSRNPAYDVYVFMTQDAYLTDDGALEAIVAPFLDSDVGAVCGRQLPHLDATLLAQHARNFNYPAENKVKTQQDIPVLGVKAAFISNSFSAYRSEALGDVESFPEHVILSEDMYVAAKMLLAGWKVAYAGDAECRHSHNYTIVEEFRRYFDIGVFHARESWIRENFGGAGGEGLRYVKSELKFLGLRRLYLWPSSLVRNACKLIAYKLGQQERFLPIGLKRRLSMHRRYWDGPYARDN